VADCWHCDLSTTFLNDFPTSFHVHKAIVTNEWPCNAILYTITQRYALCLYGGLGGNGISCYDTYICHGGNDIMVLVIIQPDTPVWQCVNAVNE